MRIAADNTTRSTTLSNDRGAHLGARIVSLAHLATSVHMARVNERARAQALVKILSKEAAS